MLDSAMLLQYINSIGVATINDDNDLITVCLNDAINEVLNNINCSSLPQGLENDTLKLATSKFLFFRKAFNPQSFSNMDLNRTVKQVSVGDVSTTFEDSTSDSAKIDFVIECLKNSIVPLYARYRRLTW